MEFFEDKILTDQEIVRKHKDCTDALESYIKDLFETIINRNFLLFYYNNADRYYFKPINPIFPEFNEMVEFPTDISKLALNILGDFQPFVYDDIMLHKISSSDFKSKKEFIHTAYKTITEDNKKIEEIFQKIIIAFELRICLQAYLLISSEVGECKFTAHELKKGCHAIDISKLNDKNNLDYYPSSRHCLSIIKKKDFDEGLKYLIWVKDFYPNIDYEKLNNKKTIKYGKELKVKIKLIYMLILEYNLSGKLFLLNQEFVSKHFNSIAQDTLVEIMDILNADSNIFKYPENDGIGVRLISSVAMESLNYGNKEKFVRLFLNETKIDFSFKGIIELFVDSADEYWDDEFESPVFIEQWTTIPADTISKNKKILSQYKA